MVNEKITGKIELINTRTVNTKTGQAVVTDLTINGVTISSFKPVGELGDTVEAEFYTNNGYRNATNIKLVEKAKGQVDLKKFGAGPVKFTFSDRIDIGQMMVLAESENARLGKKEPLSADDVARFVALYKKVNIEQS